MEFDFAVNPPTTLAVAEIALRVGQNNAYAVVKAAYDNDGEGYFNVIKIGQQYRTITDSFKDWLYIRNR
jgi:hypothetical protein